MSQPAYLLIGHGSRDPDAIAQCEQLRTHLQAALPEAVVALGFLEFAQPMIDEAIDALVAAGQTHIVLLPAILLAATHAKSDLPHYHHSAQQRHPHVQFDFASPINLHPALLALCQRRLYHTDAPPQESCLVVVGRGTSDPDANAEVARLARHLQEHFGYAAVQVCYSGTAQPDLDTGLQHAARLGLSNIVVFPFFLFTGVLMRRIEAAVERSRRRHPEQRHRMTEPLGTDPTVAEVLIERATLAATADAPPNPCTLCRYRPSAHPIATVLPRSAPYVPHPIEAESMAIIDAGRDWSGFPAAHHTVLKRLVHTTGDFSVPEGIFISAGAVQQGVQSLLRCRQVICDVTMVQSGFKRALLQQLDIETWCGVHDPETHDLAAATGLTRSAAGIRRAAAQFGDGVVVCIGDAPTALEETLRLIREGQWRPQLVIGLPVGFVGTEASKTALRNLLQVSRITNSGTRGGSPWAATVFNALMIDAIGQLSQDVCAP